MDLSRSFCYSHELQHRPERKSLFDVIPTIQGPCNVTSRQHGLECQGAWEIQHQNRTTNKILDVLADENGNGAEEYIDVASKILSRMIYLESKIHFRLRGDTVEYLAELLQGWLIKRLEDAVLFAIHGYKGGVQWESIQLAFQNCDKSGLGLYCPQAGYFNQRSTSNT
jgi:histone H3/H4